MSQPVELLASYFTLAGDVRPFGPTEVSPFPFEDRVAAAADAGWMGMGTIFQDVEATEARIGLAAMRRTFEASGMRYLELEFLPDWFADGEARRRSDVLRERMKRYAGELGLFQVKVAPGLGRDVAKPTDAELVADVPRMTAAFRRLAEEALAADTRVILEIMPFSSVRALDVARAIVEGADHPAGGLLIDIWHVCRGGIAYTDIAEIDRRHVGSVELDDADEAVEGGLWNDTINNRRLCGEGALDQAGFIQAIRATGYDGPWGVEILSEALRREPLETAAARVFRTTISQFAPAAAAP